MRPTVLAALFLAAVLVALQPAHADEATIGPITVSAPWARATAHAGGAGGVFLTLSTSGDRGDRLIAAASPVARVVELHTHTMDDNGVMRMRPVEAIEVGPDADTVLAPGGLHVMLIGLEAPLVQGESLPLTLTFETAGTVEVDVPVAAAGAMGPPED